MRLLPALVGVCLPLALGVALAPGDEPPAAPPPAPPEASDYAGAAECARCHGEVHAHWADSTHALTFTPATRDTLPPEVWAGQEVAHPPGATKFGVVSDGFVTAETPGPDGEPSRYRVTHQVGRTRIQMLVATLPDGRMQVLPSMREHGTGVWFDYTALFFAGPGGDPDVPPVVRPGDPSFWTGPVRSWDAQCSRCHESGREALAPVPIGAGPRHRSRALGLDCESCHGPGAAHVVHQDQMLPGPDPMVRLRALTRRQQVDACLVCHMEADEIVPGYRPGETKDLLEFLDPSVLDDPDRVDPAGRPLELVYAGVSFWSSRCAEEGGLTCATCHDPHGGPNRSAMKTPPRDDAQCAKCHAEIVADPAPHTHHDAKGEGSRCVSCHMPMLTVERGHGAVTDHTISIPRPHLASDRVARDACITCHAGLRGAPPGAPPLSEIETRRAHARWWPGAQRLPAWLDAIAQARSGALDAPTRLNALLDDPSAPRFARATAPVLLARLGGASRDGLVARAKDPDSLVRRRVADALPRIPTPEAWSALVALLDDPSPPVQAHAARAALTDPARLAADKPALARVLAVLEQETRWVIDDDVRWDRLAQARWLSGDALGARAARKRQLALDPDNEHVVLPDAGGREADERAIYAEVIRASHERHASGPVTTVVLLDPARDWVANFGKASPNDSSWRELSAHLTEPTIRDFIARNTAVPPAPEGLELGVPTVRLPREELEALRTELAGKGNGIWDVWSQRFPGSAGFMEVSAIGMNPERTQAIVYTGHDVGFLHGAGHDWLLEKKNGRWFVRARRLAWMS